MKIGIIGTGEVGQTLGSAFLAEGYPVMLGSRNPSKEEVVKWQQAHPGAKTGLFSATAQFGEILVLAVAGSAAEEAIQLAGPENLAGKVLIDATNPISKQPPTAGVLHFYTSLEDSQLERLQRQVPKARFVKAFNSVGAPFMYKPAFPGGTPTMFICGNDQKKRRRFRKSLCGLVGKWRIWVRQRQPGPSSPYVYYGASPVCSTTSGLMPSSC
jgi:8-hydroxy-5-deazaflavin:NADPH oxidoreductase